MIDLTSSTLYRLDNLNKAQIQLSYQQSTGKLIDRGSDDTQIFASEIYVQDKITVYEGITFQVEKTTAQNSNADSALASMKTLLEYVKAELLKALNDTNGATERATIAVQLEGVKENMLMLANERIEGEYLFAGSNTTVKPFSQDPNTGKITYEGDGYLREVAVEYGSYREKGVTGFDMMSFAASIIVDDNSDIASEITYTQTMVQDFEKDSSLLFNSNSDKIIDNEGNIWKFDDSDNNGLIDGDENTKLYKFDGNGKTNEFFYVKSTGNLNEYETYSKIGANNAVQLDSGLTKTLTDPTFFIVQENSSTSVSKTIYTQLSSVSYTGSDNLVFTENEGKIIDNNGYEWKFTDHDNADADNDITTGIDRDRIYKFDSNGITTESLLVSPTGNLNEYTTTSTLSSIDAVQIDGGTFASLSDPVFSIVLNDLAKDPFTANTKLTFNDTTERIVDENGNEWKFIDHDNADGDNDITTGIDKNALYKFDLNGRTTESLAVIPSGNPNEYITTVNIGSANAVQIDGGGTLTISDPAFSIVLTDTSTNDYKNNVQLVFQNPGERIVDEDGNEWKFIDNDNADGDNDITTGVDNNKLYKFDRNGKSDEYYPVLATSNANEFTTSSLSTIYKDSGGTIEAVDKIMYVLDETPSSESQLVFTYGEERIIDQDGNEWKFFDSDSSGRIDADEKRKLYKFDSNGKTDEYFSVLPTGNANEYMTTKTSSVNLDGGGTKELVNTVFYTSSVAYEKSHDIVLNDDLQLAFTEGESRMMDQFGYEWKFADTNDNGKIDDNEKTKLYKYDINGKTEEYFNVIKGTTSGEFIITSALNTVNLDTGGTKTITSRSFSLYVPSESASTQILFKEDENRVIDKDGNEWKFYDENGNGSIDEDEKNKLYKFDSNGKSEEYFSVLKTGNDGEYITTSVGTVNLDSGGTKELLSPSFEVKKNIFDVLDEIIEGLKNNDVEQMRTGLDEITKSYDAVNQAHSDLGARNKVFELSLERLSTKLTQFNIFYSEVSSADPAKIAIEAKALELTYVSLYSTINRLNSMSLVNYLN